MQTIKDRKSSSLLFPGIDITPRDRTMLLNKEKLIEIVKAASEQNTMAALRQKVYDLVDQLSSFTKDRAGILNIGTNGDTLKINEKYLLGELKQIVEAQTLERGIYYINRLIKGLYEQKTSKINDINLNRWKECSDIITDSLWILHKRDNSGVHTAGYWGNFIPQIPNQMVRRYTKKGEWGLDTFAGCGTTLIETQRLGRNCLGIELKEDTAETANSLIKTDLSNFRSLICRNWKN